jgi:hypothetical protein
MITAIRRGLVLAAIGAAAGTIWTRLSKPKTSPLNPAPPPPAADSDEPPTPTNEPSNSASMVNPTSEADEQSPNDGSQTWVLPNDDGSAPATHPIKASRRSGIFHVPGGSFYNRTKPERCYATAAEAETDGYRQAKN